VNSIKRIIFLLVVVLSAALLIPWIEAGFNPASTNEFDITYELNPTANFFGQVENTTPVDLPDNYATELALKSFDKVGETDRLELYVRERFFQIAVYDKLSGYLWYSIYPDYNSLGYSGTSKYFIESGVVIEYYNLDNILIEDSKSYLSGSRYNVDIDYDYDAVENGVKAHLTYNDLAMEFDVEVSIVDDRLVVHLPMDSLVEGQIEKPMLNIDGTTTMKITKYRLKSAFLFPYFGSNNHEINGYAMIPDGSGALIRYTDKNSATAYIKRIYGTDEGNTAIPTINWTNAHLQDEMTASVPVYGINHGYQQAAFLAVLESGDANSEIHSYPYGYNSYQINTTFMKFIVRERYTIQTSSSSSDSFQLVNTEAYSDDYTLNYFFLAGEEASYAGMAKSYRRYLGLDGSIANQAAIHLKLITQDYKNGLFGKNFVEMTTYEQIQAIVEELRATGVDSLELEAFAWTQNGFYQNGSDRPQAALNLGGRSGLEELNAYLDEHGVYIYYTRNPLVAFEASLGQGVVKKVTLMSFATPSVNSSLMNLAYYRDPASIGSRITDYDKQYENLGITSLALETVGQKVFSYRSGGITRTRAEALEATIEQIALLDQYRLAMIRPNGYLYPYLASYYRMPIESNKYSYMTDSIPFLPMVLHSRVAMYSDYVNYVSDYGLFSLRLVEYGVSPAFIVSAEPTYQLRHTNLEYLFTTEFALWKPTIQTMQEEVGDKLAMLNAHEIVYHRYVLPGVAETTYSDGTIVYVNYTSTPQTVAVGRTIPAFSSKVVSIE
jgi:hypothetical protein